MASALSIDRKTLRAKPVRKPRRAHLATLLKAYAKKYPRRGYRKAWAHLRRGGEHADPKTIQSIWREEGLQVSRKKRARKSPPDQVFVPHVTDGLNQIWAYDFVHDQTIDGRPLRFLTLIDIHSRECLDISVDRKLGSSDVRRVLWRLFAERGIPGYLRSDNGSEFGAHIVRNAIRDLGAKTQFIDPGSPWQNGHNESFNAIFRDEFLNQELLGSLAESRVLTAEWRTDYNEERAHGAIGLLTPAEFAAQLEAA